MGVERAVTPTAGGSRAKPVLDYPSQRQTNNQRFSGKKWLRKRAIAARSWTSQGCSLPRIDRFSVVG